MGLLARAKGDAIAALVAGIDLPTHTRIRGPETGLVMLRGRAGGDGAAFNLGEMTTTRCTIRTSAGQVGHAYVAGRDGRQAELAALLDALLQDADWHDAMMAAVIEPLNAAERARHALRARRAAATRVDFLAMATMR
ncbi:phosphonate C-P lyase system protein PhnG [Roseomonas arctica]|uniref:Phosphonate C-P lyase system protein PhnG n=2 Tax=Plastoroseomonas arctica TaxID=1509237 RepID=A0AAF1K1Q3_9PROT|nr:phosphonate C-P lyase system protein PhnG [Plastoroseomonas arctica]